MKLNVGCGGKKYAFYDLGCEVNCDVQKPKAKISNFILSDICSLPFKDKVFQCVYAFNVLEHVDDHGKAVKELNRVSNDEVLIRLDKIYNLANWFTSDHEKITLQNVLIPYPRSIKWLVKLARFPIDHSNIFRDIIHSTFPVFRKLGLLDRWNYYRVE